MEENKTLKWWEVEGKKANGIEINGILADSDLKLDGNQLNDLFIDFVESLGLEFGGGINFVDVNDDNDK